MRLYELREISRVMGMPYMDVLRIALGEEFDEDKASKEAVARYSADFLREALKVRR